MTLYDAERAADLVGEKLADIKRRMFTERRDSMRLALARHLAIDDHYLQIIEQALDDYVEAVIDVKLLDR